VSKRLPSRTLLLLSAFLALGSGCHKEPETFRPAGTGALPGKSAPPRVPQGAMPPPPAGSTR
jgi:hypothetical protein